jgi:DNA invertase Pin-like site-specific DNA recombinase
MNVPAAAHETGNPRKAGAEAGVVGKAIGVALAQRLAAPTPERPTELEKRARLNPRPTNGARAKPDGSPESTENTGDSGNELAGGERVLLVGAGLALLLTGAFALAVVRPGRRHAAAALVDFGSLAASPTPRRSALVAVASPPRLTQARSPAGRPNLPEPGARAPGGPRNGPMLGYAPVSVSLSSRNGDAVSGEMKVIANECEQRGLALLEVVRELFDDQGLERPGLEYVLREISEGEAQGLVVSELSRLCSSVADLGVILEWFMRHDARLIAVGEQLDTYESAGRLASRALIEVAAWQRRDIERTDGRPQAPHPKGRRAVADDPDLVQRIKEMRANSMSLKAIADRLNAEGVPTVRGGLKWRPSSVQAATGYHRPRRPPNGPSVRRGPVPRRNGSHSSPQ